MASRWVPPDAEPADVTSLVQRAKADLQHDVERPAREAEALLRVAVRREVHLIANIDRTTMVDLQYELLRYRIRTPGISAGDISGLISEAEGLLDASRIPSAPTGEVLYLDLPADAAGPRQSKPDPNDALRRPWNAVPKWWREAVR